MDFAIFVSATRDYLPYLNALLNSLERCELDIPVYLIHTDLPSRYLDVVTGAFTFPVNIVEVDRQQFDVHPRNRGNENLFSKQSRFKYLRELGVRHDVVCLLDADMFVVSHNFLNLFKMVYGTPLLVGCNERFKWVFDHRYTTRGQVLFSTPVRALKFHCSVPVIFDAKKWQDVLDHYNWMAFQSFEIEDGKVKKPVGDIFCWNISVYRCRRQDDVVLFPMEVMTQVHDTAIRPMTRLQKWRGYWMTEAGDEVFSIHGRIGRKWFEEGVARAESLGLAQEEVERSKHVLREVWREWVSLNTDGRIDVREFVRIDAL